MARNKARLHKVADAIERGVASRTKVRFDMSDWVVERTRGPQCGTAACIAGHAALLFDPSFKSKDKRATNLIDKWGVGILKPYSTDLVYISARDALGLSDVAAEALFMPHVYADGFTGNLSAVSVKRAVKVIRYFAETGIIEWNTRKHRKLAVVTGSGRA